MGGYGATVARLTPDQKVGSSNLSALICVHLANMQEGLLTPDQKDIQEGLVSKPMPCLTQNNSGDFDAFSITGMAWGMDIVAPEHAPEHLHHGGVWRNGSASDSRSEGWEFESLCPHLCSN